MKDKVKEANEGLIRKDPWGKSIFFFLWKSTSLGNKDFRGVLSLIKKAFLSDER